MLFEHINEPFNEVQWPFQTHLCCCRASDPGTGVAPRHGLDIVSDGVVFSFRVVGRQIPSVFDAVELTRDTRDKKRRNGTNVSNVFERGRFVGPVRLNVRMEIQMEQQTDVPCSCRYLSVGPRSMMRYKQEAAFIHFSPSSGAAAATTWTSGTKENKSNRSPSTLMLQLNTHVFIDCK